MILMRNLYFLNDPLLRLRACRPKLEPRATARCVIFTNSSTPFWWAEVLGLALDNRFGHSLDFRKSLAAHIKWRPIFEIQREVYIGAEKSIADNLGAEYSLND